MKSIIIIGSGAAGLMTAYQLSKHHLTVTVLEAKNRLGGRIFTENNNAFSQPFETGAEFIHGDLPVTLSLLKQAGISYHSINGKMLQLSKGKIKKEKHFTDGWDKLMQQMADIKQDMPLHDFLMKFFGDDKYDKLRESAEGFAGGFDLADISIASTKALYKEWSEEMKHQYRIDGGYQKLIDYLETQCKKNGCIIQTNCCAKKINWHKNEVSILTMCSRLFKGNKTIIAVPVSVLQANTNDENYIEFEPAVPQHIQAAKNIGYGDVIKILLEFTESFWNEKKKNAGFILMDEEIPTWWTQLPVKNNLLTGWLGGAKATALKNETDAVILSKALQSLANAFEIDHAELKTKLKAYKIFNWCKEPDINGGYSFNTIKSIEAKKILRQPIEDTLFFAGETLFEGTPVGTVEAALSNAKKTAALVLKTL